MAKRKNYWLFKTEPSDYSIDDLAGEKNQTTFWDGVRNYQARNTLRDDVKVGDRVVLYHSSCEVPAAVGVASVVKDGYADHTALDPDNKHYDPKSSEENTRWYMVDIKLDEKFARPVPLVELRTVKALSEMVLLQKGSRLSVQPVTKKEFDVVVKLGRKKE